MQHTLGESSPLPRGYEMLPWCTVEPHACGRKDDEDEADDEDGEETKRIQERYGCRKRGKKRKTNGMVKTRLTKRPMKQRRMMVMGSMKVKTKAKDGDADDFFVLTLSNRFPI